MDSYTSEMKSWLDSRFRKVDSAGIYWAHQPIYGFRKGPTEPGMTNRYAITYQTMKALSHLNFKTFLDVGGAEGYKAALVKLLFNSEVRTCDLSEEACLRAKEIFGVDGDPVDIHHLPYADDQFDVVLCSETLEHVEDMESATTELLRVSRKALVITVPHEPERIIQRNISKNIPHAHIHSLDVNSFNFTCPPATRILVRKMLPPFLKIACVVVDGIKRGRVEGYPDVLVQLYDALVPVFQFVFGEKSVSLLISADNLLSKYSKSYSGMTLVILKDESCYCEKPKRLVSPSQVIGFKVPFHYM